MRVLAYCAEQDVFSAEHLKTIEKFKGALEAQRWSTTTMGTTLPALEYDTTPQTSFSGPFYNKPRNSGQMAFAAQPYSGTMAQEDSVPPIPQYSFPSEGMPSVGRSDSQSTSYSNIYDWMATGASDGQTLNFTMDNHPAPIQTTTQHYHPFLQDFYRYEELSWMNYSA
jgi:hypothetical protein